MELALTSPLPLPAPRFDITIRRGTNDDIPFMDALQKKTTRQVGWMPTKQFEGKVAAGHVLIAETRNSDEVTERRSDEVGVDPSLRHSVTSSLRHSTPVGYLIGNDQYFKRDDVGIIYQINVVEEYRRSFVGAALLKAQFERSAYGCKLYCCWCAQDIAANRFWESMGFVPLAYRVGSLTKGRGTRDEGRVGRDGAAKAPHSSLDPRPSSLTPRVHIFWQKRIRAGDDSTPWWYPAKTDGGAIREDRIILPIPPGVKWSDELPLLLPERVASCQLSVASEGEKARKPVKRAKKAVVPEPAKPVQVEVCFGRPGKVFAPPAPKVEEALPAPAEPTPAPVVEKPKRVKRKADPALVAKSRELRDRYLEQVNAQRMLVAGKYDVARVIETTALPPTNLLAA